MDYELNGADAQSAFLWFLIHEQERHMQDLIRIRIDIRRLRELGVKLPTTPTEVFVKVPGVDYDT